MYFVCVTLIHNDIRCVWRNNERILAFITIDVQVYDPGLNEWRMQGTMQEPRFSMGIVSHQGLIYIVGGCTHSRRHMQELVSYNPVTNEWSTLANMLVPRSEDFYQKTAACLRDAFKPSLHFSKTFLKCVSSHSKSFRGGRIVRPEFNPFFRKPIFPILEDFLAHLNYFLAHFFILSEK